MSYGEKVPGAYFLFLFSACLGEEEARGRCAPRGLSEARTGAVGGESEEYDVT